MVEFVSIKVMDQMEFLRIQLTAMSSHRVELRVK